MSSQKKLNKNNFVTYSKIVKKLTYIDYLKLEDLPDDMVKVQEVRKKLSKSSQLFYAHLLDVFGGELDQKCWQSTLTMADHVNCSTGTIVNSKRELQQQFEQIDMPLISIAKRKRFSYDASNKKTNSVIEDTIHHEDPGKFWDRTAWFFKEGKDLPLRELSTKIVHKSVYNSRRVQKRSPEEGGAFKNETESPTRRVQNLASNKTEKPLLKEQDTQQKVSCSFKSGISVSSASTPRQASLSQSDADITAYFEERMQELKREESHMDRLVRNMEILGVESTYIRNIRTEMGNRYIGTDRLELLIKYAIHRSSKKKINQSLGGHIYSSLVKGYEINDRSFNPNQVPLL